MSERVTLVQFLINFGNVIHVSTQVGRVGVGSTPPPHKHGWGTVQDEGGKTSGLSGSNYEGRVT